MRGGQVIAQSMKQMRAIYGKNATCTRIVDQSTTSNTKTTRTEFKSAQQFKRHNSSTVSARATDSASKQKWLRC